MASLDGLSAGSGLREGSNTKVAIFNFDKHGIACGNPEFPPHGRRDDELATFNDLGPPLGLLKSRFQNTLRTSGGDGRMRKRTAVCGAWAIAGLSMLASGEPAWAQAAKPSLDSILQSGGAGANDLRRIEDGLSSDDPDTRIATLDAIVASGEPFYIAKAMEVALLSDDPRLRQAALRTRFQAGGNYRVEVDLTGPSKEATDAAGWLRRNGGSISTDGGSGLMNVPLGEWYEAGHCWRHLTWNSCAFSLAGEQVFFSSRDNAEGQLRLDETGTLAGSLLVGGKGTPVPIHILLLQ